MAHCSRLGPWYSFYRCQLLAQKATKRQVDRSKRNQRTRNQLAVSFFHAGSSCRLWKRITSRQIACPLWRISQLFRQPPLHSFPLLPLWVFLEEEAVERDTRVKGYHLPPHLELFHDRSYASLIKKGNRKHNLCNSSKSGRILKPPDALGLMASTTG